MPFERLADRVSHKATKNHFTMSVRKTGLIIIYFPPTHPLCQSRRVITEIGTGADKGLVRLVASEATGRVVYKSPSKKSGWHVRYTQLPGIKTDKVFNINLVDHIYPDGVLLEMPFYTQSHSPIINPPAAKMDSTSSSIFSQPRAKEPPQRIVQDEPILNPKPTNSGAAQFTLRKGV